MLSHRQGVFMFVVTIRFKGKFLRRISHPNGETMLFRDKEIAQDVADEYNGFGNNISAEAQPVKPRVKKA
jgi:hypothetical protein